MRQRAERRREWPVGATKPGGRALDRGRRELGGEGANPKGGQESIEGIKVEMRVERGSGGQEDTRRADCRKEVNTSGRG